jgi:hypothetical protein
MSMGNMWQRHARWGITGCYVIVQSKKIFIVLIVIISSLYGCCGKILPYQTPQGVPTVKVTFENQAHLDSNRTTHINVIVFKDDFACRRINEVSGFNREISILAESRSHFTFNYKVGSYLPNNPNTYNNRCSGMYTFPIKPDCEYRVQFDEKDGYCYLRVLSRSVDAGLEWKAIEELFPRKMNVPFCIDDGSWCKEDERFRVPVRTPP